MSETWVIKDNAPVDEASLTLATTNISFTTNNQKATSIGIEHDGSIVMLIYGGVVDGGAEFDLSVTSSFEWYNEAYRTLEFDTATTGELLAWLQKNADMQDKTYLTTTSELKSIADAIRAKGGTTDPLVYPGGFVTAIGALRTTT